jgi:hypothetical protein
MDCAAVRSSLELLRINGLTQDPYDWLVRQGAILDLLAPQEKVLDAPKTLAAANRMLPISTYDNLDHMERKLFVAIESIRAKVGILSLSERYDSLPMWAHYADQAKGFVVIFEDPERSFKGDDTGSLNGPKHVVYTERFIGMTDPSTQDRLFFSKLSDWSYEREWRVVTAVSARRGSTSPDRPDLRLTCGRGRPFVASLRLSAQPHVYRASLNPGMWSVWFEWSRIGHAERSKTV